MKCWSVYINVNLSAHHLVCTYVNVLLKIILLIKLSENNKCLMEKMIKIWWYIALMVIIFSKFEINMQLEITFWNKSKTRCSLHGYDPWRLWIHYCMHASWSTLPTILISRHVLLSKFDVELSSNNIPLWFSDREI